MLGQVATSSCRMWEGEARRRFHFLKKRATRSEDATRNRRDAIKRNSLGREPMPSPGQHPLLMALVDSLANKVLSSESI